MPSKYRLTIYKDGFVEETEAYELSTILALLIVERPKEYWLEGQWTINGEWHTIAKS